MIIVKITEVVPDVDQPRKYFAAEKMASLKDSIKKHGIISPLIVEKRSGKYYLIDGERRFRAASDLHLGTVPVEVITSKDPFVRLLEQFHIQEQHEAWTQTEKALAIEEIAKQSKKSLKEICDMLSIGERTARTYIAFAGLQNKEKFIQAQCSMSSVEKIGELKRFIKRLKENELGEPLTKADEGKIEKVLIEKIKDGEIVGTSDYTRIKDSLLANPKLIEGFVNGKEFDIDQMFIKTKAKGAYYYRNMMQNGGYFFGNAMSFLKEKSVKLTEGDIARLKNIKKAAEQLINLAE